MPSATFSGNSGYRLDVTPSRNGKTISVTVKVVRTTTWQVRWTAAQPWSVSFDGQVQSDSWTYNFYDPTTSITLGTKSRAYTTIGKKNYSVTVQMQNGVGSATVSGTVDIPPSAPNAPTSVNVTRNSDTSQTVTWTRNATADRPYYSQSIQRQERASSSSWTSWQTIATNNTDYTNSGSNSYTDTSTKANQLYNYRIVANNTAGSTASSSFQWVFTTPNAPTLVEAEAVSATDVQVTVSQNIFHTEYTTELQYSSAGGAWTALATLPKGTHTHTFTPPAAASVQVRARLVISASGKPGNGLASAYTNSNVVPLQAPPLAPTSLSPNGVVLDYAKASTFSWVYTSVDTSKQRQYEIEYQVSGAGSWTSTGVVTSNSKSRVFAAGYFAKDTDYLWRVRTWGVHVNAGPWSTPASFRFQNAPVVNITSPTGVAEDSQVTVEWDAVTNQAYWKASLSKDGVVLESLSGSGNANSVMFSTLLENGSSYVVVVQVADSSGLWSDEASVEFLADFPSPDSPEFTLGWDDQQGAVLIEVDNPPTPVNRATNPSFEAAGPVQTVRTNWHTNPFNGGGYTNGLALGNLAYSSGGATTTYKWDAGWQYVTVSSLAAGARAGFRRTMPISAPANTPVRVSARLPSALPAGLSAQIYADFRNDSGQIIGNANAFAVGAEMVAEMTVPAGQKAVEVLWYVWVTPTSGSWSSGVARDIGFSWFLIEVGPATAVGSSADVFSGQSAAAGDFTYAWSGTPFASTSVQRATTVEGVTGGNARVVQSSEWASSGSKSLRLMPGYFSRGSSYQDISSSIGNNVFGLVPGKTYTASLKARQAEPRTAANRAMISIVTQNTDPTAPSAQAFVPLEAGVHDITFTFKVPSTGWWYLRLYNNGQYGDPDVWYDDLIIVEGEQAVEYGDGDTPGWSWTGTPHASASTRADAVSNTVYRSYDGENWVLVATGLPLDSTITDPEVILNREVFYQVLAVSALGTTSDPTMHSIFTTATMGYWSVGEGFYLVQTLRMNLGDPPGIDLDTGLAQKQRHYFAGRTLPLEYAGTARQRTGEAVFMVGTVAERDQVVEMSYMPAPHLFRLPDGTYLYASVDPVSHHREDEGFYTCSVPLTEVQYG